MEPNEARVACKETGPIIWNSKEKPEGYFFKISYGCGWFDLYTPNGSISTLYRARTEVSKPLVDDYFRRENRPNR
ncbi:MAG TPA: hypothetical protein PKA82_04930 [Pyrinomonadaceae bacterium]|nr:hypothetical protein [Pyrinomonadaceae bacterium]